jgi:hypothetical protein
MKYKTRITSRGTKYIGELLENGHVIYTTNELNDPVIVSRALAQHISQLTSQPTSLPQVGATTPELKQTPVANSVTRNFLNAERAPMRHSQPPVRKCCGR